MVAECIFCKIVAEEIPAEIVYETDDILAFKDVNPEAPVHLLVIPKQHINNILELADNDPNLFYNVGLAIKQLANDFSLEDGFRVVNNCGSAAGQSVNHIHFHLMGGRNFVWPPG